MDESQKLPQHLLGGICIHLVHQSDCPLLALDVAGWIRYVSGVDDAGKTINIRDPASG